MCSVCRQNPCSPRCPNAEEAKPVKRCCRCNDGIYEGDEYLFTVDGCICRECLESLTVEEWLELYEESLTVAEREER
jgi:hypothetical protein